MDYEALMHLAIEEAAKSEHDVPVGAVLVADSGELIAKGHNLKERTLDPTAHAEIVAIREASRIQKDWRLEDLTLVVTLEPCAMCSGAIVASRIQRVVFGAWDERAGAAGSVYDLPRDPRLGSPIEVVAGVLESSCRNLLETFFRSKR